ncbi:hypothetical protein [Methylobacterium sp. WL120]|uniref:hypothetical protein n=1 Tax=Methylobacterium sp. WL120 TaxID=2603887 RepID=UPI0011CA9113|nr:hypothetical protein [Methylobacterium sp. WL120]TXM68183.1 hypothetical protein FV229_08400 [Methylobacterium sp. WL120]
MTIVSQIGSTSFPATQDSFITSGFYAVGDLGRGLMYVRGGGYRQVADAQGQVWHVADTDDIHASQLGVVTFNTNYAQFNADVINEAIRYLGQRRGGRLRLPPGDIYANQTIESIYGYVTVEGNGAGYPHDAGAGIVFGTTLVATHGGVALRDRTPGAAERGVDKTQNWKNMGGGFVGFRVTGSFSRGLHVTSRNKAKYHLYIDGATQQGAFFDCLPDSRNGTQNYEIQEPGDNQVLDLDLDVRVSGSADGVYFSGNQNSGNTSIIHRAHITVYHQNGHGVVYFNADNVIINALRTFGNGSGRSFYVCATTGPGAYTYGNEIQNYSANTLGFIEAISNRPGSNQHGKMYIGSMDVGNGTQQPTLGGTGAQFWLRNGQDGEMVFNNGLGPWSLSQIGAYGGVEDGSLQYYCGITGKGFVMRKDGTLRLGTGTILR